MSETIQIPKGWELKKLGDVCEPSKYGYTSKSHKEKRGIPYIRITDLNENGTTLRPGRVFVDIDDKQLKTYKLQKGDILIARTADVGRSFLFNEDETMVFASYLIRFRPKQEIIEPKFLLYVLKSNFFWTHIGLKTTTTAVSNVNAGNLSKFEFLCPQLPIQKKIVQKLDDILGQLEEKKKEIFSIIEQNKQRIDFFEKNWFTYIIDREIEKHPQRKEWKEVHTIDVIENPKKSIRIGPFGSSLKKHELTDSGIRVLFIENVVNNKFEYKTGKFITTEKYEELKGFTVKPNDILVTMMGTIGRICIVPEDIGTAIISSHLLKISLDQKKILPEYFVLLLQSPITFKQMKKESRGISMPGLNSKIIKNLEFPLPSIPTQKQIIQNIKNAEEKFQSQKVQFENIKQNYEKTINYINHIQSSILDTAFSGKLVQ